jgi:hypothetical protein
LEDLDFADDICILAQSFKGMEAKMNDLKSRSPKHWNVDKLSED